MEGLDSVASTRRNVRTNQPIPAQFFLKPLPCGTTLTPAQRRVLVHAIKHIGMRGTQWTTSNFDTIQLRVLKIGARVREQATKIRFHFPTSYPLKDLMKTIVLNLDTA